MKTKTHSIRFPKELYDTIERDADKDVRSVSKQIVYICQIYYQKMQQRAQDYPELKEHIYPK